MVPTNAASPFQWVAVVKHMRQNRNHNFHPRKTMRGSHVETRPHLEHYGATRVEWGRDILSGFDVPGKRSCVQP